MSFSIEGIKKELTSWVELKTRGDVLPREGLCMEAFVLKHGRMWTAAPRPKGHRRRQPKQCFANSQRLLLDQDFPPQWTYVEGYAYSGANMLTFVFHHGWLVDHAGNVLDLTWEFPEKSVYFGVPFKPGYVWGQTAASSHYHSLLQYHFDSFSLLRGKTPLEDALWP